MHKYQTIIRYLIALVWFVNGLLCKLLNLVPRHKEIVGRILGDANASFFTTTIGVLEILMAIWVISRIWEKWCAITQIIIVLTMNIMEFILVPDILLFGKLNLFIAILFVAIVYGNTFLITKKHTANV